MLWHGNQYQVRVGEGPSSVAEVLELEGDLEVGFLEGGDDGLEVVALLAGDAELVALHLDLDLLGALVADQLADLLGLLLRDALLQRDADLGLAAGLARLA